MGKNPGPPDYKIPSLIADLPNYVLNSKGFGKSALKYWYIIILFFKHKLLYYLLFKKWNR